MRKRIESFKHAFRGIIDFIIMGTNARIQLASAVLIIVTGFILDFTFTEWIAVTICIGFVLAAEAMNTALEELANEVSQEKRERIRKAKDIAAGSVLIAAITAFLVAIQILVKRL